MNAIELLKSQHREVETLFKQLEDLGEGAAAEKKEIFATIALKLSVHAAIEEKIFYPEGEAVDEDTTLEAYEEHDVVKALLSKISKTRPTDKTFMAKVTVLKEVVEHHVEEEENEYFPECEKELGAEKLEALGEKLAAATARLEDGAKKPRRARSAKKPKAKTKTKSKRQASR